LRARGNLFSDAGFSAKAHSAMAARRQQLAIMIDKFCNQRVTRSVTLSLFNPALGPATQEVRA
jgi:hypothetical protein